MADQIIHEMIAAFAAGCMDKQNFIQFKDYLQEGGDLPHGELGELQNIISMVPVILDMETPDPAIKDMVAKKLIGMKDEIKAKIISERKTLASTFTTASSTKEFSATLPPPPLKLKPSTLTYQTKESFDLDALKMSDVDFKKTFTKSENLDKASANLGPLASATVPKDTADDLKIKTSLGALPPAEIPSEKEAGSSNWMGIIGIILSVVFFSLIGFYTYTSVSKLEENVSELQKELVTVKGQLAASNNFINNYASLVEFFNYKDIEIVNLANPAPELKQNAKLLLSFSEKEGLIQFRNTQTLQSDQVFQLWAINRGQAYSLGSYRPTGNEYLNISFPFLPREQIGEFRVTIESASGVTTPSQNTYLTGVFEKPAAGRRAY